MKKLVIFTILLAALVLSAVNPWPAQLRVWNYTGDNIYFRLSYRGEQKYFLTATVKGNTDTYKYSLFEVARKKYTAEVTACDVTATGTMDLNTSLKLTFTDCDMMRQVKGVYIKDNPVFWPHPGAYWGEPGMEKPNFYQHWDTYKQLWEFDNLSLCGADTWCFFVYAPRKLNWEQWQFKYDLPADYEKSVTFILLKDECYMFFPFTCPGDGVPIDYGEVPLP